MVDRKTSSQLNRELKSQFLRRTPIKLRQFARLLGDMIERNLDPLRVKALNSQVGRTREACIAQEFNSTAILLQQLLSQLSVDLGPLEFRRPMLQALIKELLAHSANLELGVNPGDVDEINELSENNGSTTEREQSANISESEFQISEKEAQEPVRNESFEEIPEEQIPTISEYIEEEAQIDEDDKPEIIEDDDVGLDHFDAYIDDGKLFFVDDAEFNIKQLFEQFESFGVESYLADDIESALQMARDYTNAVVVASINHAKHDKVLPDESVEIQNVPIIFIANEDNQFNRASVVRNGGSGFIVEPVSVSALCKQIELCCDLHENAPKRILVMEDSKAQSRYYEKVLNKGNFIVKVVNDPQIFVEALRGFQPETVLMDMQMPGSSGIELTQIIRQMSSYTHLPVIFLSAEESLSKQNQALMSGGTAFISKPVKKEQLMFMANLYTQRYRDLNPQIEVNPDTGLPYSKHFKRMIAIESARVSRRPAPLALAIIHLDDSETLESSDHYSFINSTIQQLAHLMRKRLRKTDIIGHVDGCRLGIILTSGRRNDWIYVLEKLQEQFSALTFQLHKEYKPMSITIGASELDSNFNVHQWLERSMSALDSALDKGPSNLVFYDGDDN